MHGRVVVQDVQEVEQTLTALRVTRPVTIETLKAAEEPRPIPTGRRERTVTARCLRSVSFEVDKLYLRD